MRILVVDDSPIKMKHIIESIRDTQSGRTAEILTADCGHEALMTLLVEDIDYLVSDMHYQWRRTELSDLYCGKRLLEEMKEAGIMTKTIICSSDRTNMDAYDNVIGYVVYQGKEMGKRFSDFIH